MKTDWGSLNKNVELSGSQKIGRIIKKNREHYTIVSNTETYKGSVSGKFRHNSTSAASMPVIGDWVIFEKSDNLAIIKSVISRKSIISRKVAGITTEEQPIAANIDVIGIVMGLDGGRNYSPRTLERYLTIAWDSGALPVVILNKADLADDPESIKAEAEFISPGVEVILSSAVTGLGTEPIRDHIKDGETAVFIGPSGVGKSALTNRLLGLETQKTGETRQSDKKGKHTTTASSMFKLPNKGILIDSPGLKEIQLWGDEDSLDHVFEEIAEFAKNCKFKDCSHEVEPGCTVQQALAEGQLDPLRYNNFLDLKKELIYLESKQDEKARRDWHEKNKKLGKMYKEVLSKKVIY